MYNIYLIMSFTFLLMGFPLLILRHKTSFTPPGSCLVICHWVDCSALLAVMKHASVCRLLSLNEYLRECGLETLSSTQAGHGRIIKTFYQSSLASSPIQSMPFTVILYEKHTGGINTINHKRNNNRKGFMMSS